MTYSIKTKRNAAKSLAKIPQRYRKNIITAIKNLSSNPKPIGCKKLSGRDAWRIRIGKYRVIYEIEDYKLVILIIEIGHRSSVYR